MTTPTTATGSAPSREFLTTGELADRLRVAPQTLVNWRHTGRGPRSLKLGRRRLYARADVDMWIAEQRLASN